MSTLELVPKHLTAEELEAGLDEIRRAPKDEGVLELIVRRPAVNEREVLMEGELSLVKGLVGDSWERRRSSSTPDGSPNPEMQLNIMSARVIALVAEVVAGLSRNRGNLAAPSGLSKIRRAFRFGGNDVRQLTFGKTTSSPRDQCKGGSSRSDSRRRSGREDLTWLGVLS